FAGNFGKLHMEGGFAGGQIGYNWITASNWVLGIEADAQGAGIVADRNAAALLAPNIFAVASHDKIDFFGTLRARAGMNYLGALLYVTGGLAWGNIRYRVNSADAVGTFANITSTSPRLGWVGGGGVELPLGGQWTGKLEYQYLQFERQNLTAGEFTP